MDESFGVIVSGPPGTGKTTLGQRLAADLRFPFHSKDRIKERLFDTLGWSDRAWSRKLGVATMELLYDLVEMELAAGRSFVVESNFHPEYATPRFAALRAQYGFRPFQIQCETDPAVLVARFRARATSGARHPGHVEESFDGAALDAMVGPGRYADLAIGGPVVRIETTDFARVDYAGLLAAVRAAGADTGATSPG